MPNSVLDDLGFGDNQVNTASPTQQGDPVAWTLLGEAGDDPKGQLAVASTIANRASALKTDYSHIVSDPAQGYEGWQDPDARAKTQKNFPVGSPAYNRALSLIGDLQTGAVQPLPYTHFYSPSAQAAKNRPVPDWSNGQTPTPIGKNQFYTIPSNSASAPSALDTLGFNGGAPGSDPDVTNSVTGAPLPDYQAQTARRLQKETDGLATDPKTGGSTYRGMPLYVSSGDEQPQKPGDYWIDKAGGLHQVPIDYNGFTSYANGALLGGGNRLMAGVQALKATGGNPFNPELGNYFGQALDYYKDQQEAYTKEHPREAGLAQAVGNLQTIIPALALGGEVLAPVGAALGTAGEYLAGAAKGSKLTQLGSQAVNGMIQGAATNAMTAGQSDNPFLNQVGEGTLIGGVMNPSLHTLGSSVANNFYPRVNQYIADMANMAKNKFNYDLTGSQILGAVDPKGAGSTFANLAATPGSDTAANVARQSTMRMRNIANTFGEDTDTLTPQALQSTSKRIGGTMNTIAERNRITNIPDLMDNLTGVVTEAKANGGLSADELRQLNAQIGNVRSNVTKGGQLSGSAYKDLITHNGPLDLATKNQNTNISVPAQKMRRILDSAFDAEALPGDADAMSQARTQYRMFKAVEPYVGPDGKVSIPDLKSSVDSNFPSRNIYPNDLSNISNIDNLFMNHKSSGGNSWILPALKLGGATAGGAGASLLMHNPLAAAGVLAGSGALAVGKHVLSTPIAEAMDSNPYFVNRLLQGGSASYAPSMNNTIAVPLANTAASNMFRAQGNQ